MSKTELLLSKLRNISVMVSIGAFAFFVIDLLVAVLFGAIDCEGDQLFCSIGPEHFAFKTTLWILFLLFIIFLVLGRVLDIFLQKETKLVDVTAYRASLERREEVSFSETKIYSDMIKSNKKRYTERANGGDEEDFDDILEEPTSKLRDKINEAKLPFFARKKLEEAERVEKEKAKEEEVIEVDESIETEEIIETEPKPTFKEKLQPLVGKVKDINWKFWKKDTPETESEVVKEDSKVEEIEDENQEPKQTFMEKVKAVNWMFWVKEKSEKSSDLDDETDEEEVIKEELDKSTKTKGSKVTVVSTKEETKEPEVIEESPKAREFYTRLNKGELIEIVAKATGLSKAKSRLALNTTLNIITEQVKKEDEVKIGKFGRFKKVEVKEGKEVNPQTGKTTKIEAGFTVNFYPDKVFKDMMLEDVDQTSGKYLLNKTAMKKMTETEVEEELYKENKVHEHVDVKVVQASKAKEEKPTAKPIIKKVEEPKVEPVVEKEEPKVIKKEPVIVKKEPKVKATPVVEEKVETPVVKEAPKPKPKPKKVSVVTKTKADLIEYIFETTEISKNKSNKFLGTFSKVITAALAEGKDVDLPGIGVITTIVMPAKEAVNPQTKQKIIVPEHRQVRMRFSDEYKKKFE